MLSLDEADTFWRIQFRQQVDGLIMAAMELVLHFLYCEDNECPSFLIKPVVHQGQFQAIQEQSI